MPASQSGPTMGMTFLGPETGQAGPWIAMYPALFNLQMKQIPDGRMGSVAPSRAGRGAAWVTVVGASLENELWQSQELVQVELPAGGFAVLKSAADIIIAASANGARGNQRIRGLITSEIIFIDIANYRVKVYDFSFTCKPPGFAIACCRDSAKGPSGAPPLFSPALGSFWSFRGKRWTPNLLLGRWQNEEATERQVFCSARAECTKRGEDRGGSSVVSSAAAGGAPRFALLFGRGGGLSLQLASFRSSS